MNSGESKNVLGCFVSGPSLYSEDLNTEVETIAKQKCEQFRSYIWGELGICGPLKSLKRSDYGKDMQLVLFQFYVLPLIEQLSMLKEIERYRRKERSIGIPIIIHNDNFFERSDFERRTFLIKTILEKLDLLAVVVARNKLDTNVKLLKANVAKVLS